MHLTPILISLRYIVFLTIQDTEGCWFCLGLWFPYIKNDLHKKEELSAESCVKHQLVHQMVCQAQEKF